MSLQVPDKVAIAYDLCDGPGEQHEAVEGGGCRGGGVAVDDGPDEEEARGDLQYGCEEGGADEAWRAISVSFDSGEQRRIESKKGGEPQVIIPKAECKTSSNARVCVHFVNSPTPPCTFPKPTRGTRSMTRPSTAVQSTAQTRL